MRKAFWMLRQILPVLHYTDYKCEGETYFSIWRSFFSKCYNVVTIKTQVR